MGKERIDLLYQDEDVLVVNKPADFLSVPDRYDPDLPNLKHYLRDRYEQVWPVHRLDKDTSGVICIARNEAAHRHLSQQFASHSPTKIYWALAEGRIPKPEGELQFPLAPHPGKAGRMSVSNKGQEAHTAFRVLESFASCTWLEVRLLTGRTHQIRVHFQAYGHPLVADPFYGKRTAFYLSSIKKKRFNLRADEQERPLLARTALHAASLEIVHPGTGESLKVEAPLPKDMRAVLNQLRKWNTA